jgi:putative intracellular protease/amidase
MDPDFISPAQNAPINSAPVVARIEEILDDGEWDNPLKVNDVNMGDYAALVIVGGPGAPLDICGNLHVHKLAYEAYISGKLIAALCYAVAVLALTRDPRNGHRSIIHGRQVVAHPHAWDFDFDLTYPLYGSTAENKGTDLMTSGFLYPLQYMVEDAVGANGSVTADSEATRDHPCVIRDGNILTGLSVESSIAFGDKLVQALQ